ncbi:Uncharacterised protein [Mycobacterium tuberculosis]|nr:Uncharacterised protein [Mycobacterium tuberculosis]
MRFAHGVPVEHADGNQYQYPRQHGERDVLHHGTKPGNENEQNDTVSGRRQGGLTTISDVHHRSDGRAGTGQPAEEPGGDISNPLADQFFVAPVPGAPDVVHDQRRQQ